MANKPGRAGALGAALLVAAEIIVAPVAPAWANGQCATVAPVLNVLDRCDRAVAEFIDVPTDAKAVLLRVVGAGGGGGVGTYRGADGGDGSIREGWATLPLGTTRLWVVVGGGGAAGTPGSNDSSLGGGNGGGGSAVFAHDANGLLDYLVTAGGGGGGGGSDYNTADVFGRGGDGDTAGEAAGISGFRLADPGQPGTTSGPGNGGAQAYFYPGQPGGSAPPGDVAGGGAGGMTMDLHQRGGAGGGGYTGGGGGASDFLAVGPDEYTGGGGGGGASRVNPVFLAAPVIPAWASNGNGTGGGGSTTAASDGTDGEVSMTFIGEPSISTLTPGGPTAGQNVLTIDGTGLEHATGVEVGGATCTGLTVVSDTRLTCTVPQAAAGAADVVVTSPAGSDTATGGYTYANAPHLDSVSPVSGSIAGGDTLTLTGTNLATTTAVEVAGVPCPGTGAQQAYAATSTTVSCTVPAATNGAGLTDVEVTTLGGSHTLTNGFRYTGPPVIVSVVPTAGPQNGGNAMTILGENLGGVGLVVVGNGQCASVAPTDSTVSCVVPGATAPGPVRVVVSGAAGVDEKANGYEYLPVPTIPAPVIIPNPAPTTSPAPAPTTSAPEPTPEPSSPPRLSLALAVRPGTALPGSQASVSGGGLRANSQYTVTMYSSPVRLASGYADQSGSFTTRFTVPARACVKGGLHRVVLSGFAPDGAVVTATSWLLFDDSCTTRTVSPSKPGTVLYGTFRFDHASARLTPYVKSVLKRTHATLTSAKQVTITGYTQTGSRSEAARTANRTLALRRARAARDYLRSLGLRVPIVVAGAGGVNPVKGKPQAFNRRVVVTARY